MAHPAHRAVGLRLERYAHLQQRAPRRLLCEGTVGACTCARYLFITPYRCASPTSRWGCSGAGWAKTRSSTPCACRLSSCPTLSSSADRPPTPRASSRYHAYGHLCDTPLLPSYHPPRLEQVGILLPIFGTAGFSISPSTCGPLGGHWTKVRVTILRPIIRN